MDEAAIHAHRFFAFRTFYMKMLGVALLSQAVGGAFALLAYEPCKRSAFDEMVQRSVHRGLGYRVSRFRQPPDYFLGGYAVTGDPYVFQNTLSLSGFVFGGSVF